MKLVFHKLVIQNFLSFGDTELVLSDRGFTLVEGVNKNLEDNARSNGSGKSALWDAISWALTGSTIRGITKDIVNIHTEGGCKVELVFTVNNVEYTVIRAREHKELGSTLKLYVNGVDKSGKGLRDTEKILQETLPELTASLLGSVVILGQGLPQRFSNNTPSGRKEVLEKLSKSDFMIEDIKTQLTERKSQLNTELREVQDTVLSDNSKKTLLMSSLTTAENSLATLELQVEGEAELQTQQKLLSDIQGNVSQYTTEAEQLSTQLATIAAQLSEIQVDYYNKRESITTQYAPKLDEVRRQVTEAQTEITFLTKDISQKERITDVCPTCGQKLQNVELPDITPLYSRKAVLEESLQQLTAEKQQLETAQNTALAQVDADIQSQKTNLLQQQTSVNNDLLSVKTKIRESEESKRGIERRISELEKLLSTREQKLSDLRQTIISTKETIQEIDNKILYNNEIEESIKQHLDIVNKMTTLATRDFRGYLLTNVINFIDAKAKEYAKDMYGTDKISFTLNGNSVDIVYSGKQYENLSGGERQRLDIIIQFALRDMLCQFSGFSCNLLVLDELFDGLDSLGCENVLNLITKRLTDIESVFIITHHSDIAVPADSTITVYKNELGISSIR